MLTQLSTLHCIMLFFLQTMTTQEPISCHQTLFILKMDFSCAEKSDIHIFCPKAVVSRSSSDMRLICEMRKSNYLHGGSSRYFLFTQCFMIKNAMWCFSAISGQSCNSSIVTLQRCVSHNLKANGG